MTNRLLMPLLLFLVSFSLSSCELAKGIFKAGFYSAFLLIALVVGLIIYLFSRGRS